jgi:hypothetical protein
MINKLRGYTLTVLFSGLGLPQQSHAATIAPPLLTQVQEVAQWFTGSFSNAQQVAGNPSVPFITMSNCPVQLNGDNPADETQRIYIYLQQQSTVFNRVAFYPSSVTLREGNLQKPYRSLNSSYPIRKTGGCICC